MPEQDPGPGCHFLGTAASVRVRGVGSADLTRRETFSSGAAKVQLRGAQIGKEMAETLDHPAELVPVDVTPLGVPYDATYWSGSPTVVRVESGGAPGHFRGILATAPECAQAACPIVWVGKAATMAITPAGDAPVELTSGFPLGDPAPGPTADRHLDEVALEGAEGTLTCDGVVTKIQKESLRFTAGQYGMHLGPLRLEGEVIHVDVLGQSGALRLSRLVGGAAMCSMLVVVGLLALALRRAPRRAPDGPADAPSDAKAP